MDIGESIAFIGLVVAFSLLAYCSVLDLRTRRVPNPYWIGLSLVGMAFLVARVLADEEDPAYLLVLIPVSAILADVYMESEGDSLLARSAPFLKYGIAVISIAALAYMWGGERYFQHLLAVPIVMLIVVVLYATDVLRGGADAKALIALAIMFPFYPHFGDFPLVDQGTPELEVIIPFTISVLVIASVIVAVLPLFFLAKNVAAREFEYPQGFLGYKMDHSDIAGKHVWLMERVENGRLVKYARPRQDEDLQKEVDQLVKIGESRIWITPKLPFIVPITVSLAISAIMGGILGGLF